jgi:hypothetical protein
MVRKAGLGWLMAGSLLAGCAGVPTTAVVDGKVVSRATIVVEGDPYTLKHEGAHPRPGGPSDGLRDAGGAIRGRVCGLFVDFDVQHRGDHVQLVGSLDGSHPAAIRLSEQGGVRHFSGNLGDLSVDFTIDGNGLSGNVGLRQLMLAAEGDRYNGTMHTPNTVHGDVPVVVAGRAELARMPAADQAALLPALLTCESASQHGNIAALELVVGGQAHERANESSTVYTQNRSGDEERNRPDTTLSGSEH